MDEAFGCAFTRVQSRLVSGRTARLVSLPVTESRTRSHLLLSISNRRASGEAS